MRRAPAKDCRRRGLVRPPGREFADAPRFHCGAAWPRCDALWRLRSETPFLHWVLHHETVPASCLPGRLVRRRRSKRRPGVSLERALFLRVSRPWRTSLSQHIATRRHRADAWPWTIHPRHAADAWSRLRLWRRLLRLWLLPVFPDDVLQRHFSRSVLQRAMRGRRASRFALRADRFRRLRLHRRLWWRAIRAIRPIRAVGILSSRIPWSVIESVRKG